MLALNAEGAGRIAHSAILCPLSYLCAPPTPRLNRDYDWIIFKWSQTGGCSNSGSSD